MKPRRRLVLEGLLAGEAKKEIARRLRLSVHTVHDQTKAIYRLLGVCGRAELAALFQAPSPGFAAGSGDGAAGDQNGYLPSLPHTPDDQVVYCVKLLRRRGFIVRYMAAAGAALRDRRGVGVGSLMLILALAALMARPMLEAHRNERGAVTAAVDADAPRARRFHVSGPATGEWVRVGEVRMWDRVQWATQPPGLPVELRVANRMLRAGEENLVHAPGALYLRIPAGGAEPLVNVTLEPLKLDE